jgi:hypothetical protein
MAAEDGPSGGKMQSGRKLIAALVAAVVLCAPATADAAVSATVTGDDANPVALTPAAPLAIRNMDVQATGHVDLADAKAKGKKGKRFRTLGIRTHRRSRERSRLPMLRV